MDRRTTAFMPSGRPALPSEVMSFSLPKPKAALRGLPLEIKQEILANISNFETLRSVILARCGLEYAFFNRPDYVIKQVLSNIVPAEVVPEVIAVHQARKHPVTEDTIVTTVDDYFVKLNSSTPPRGLTIQDGIEIENFHRLVAKYIHRFLDVALWDSALAKQSEATIKPPSEREMIRINRAFYLFELFAALFRKGEAEGEFRIWLIKRAITFAGRFAPWELEQIGCIHNFYLHQIEDAFDDVAAHDVEFGYWAIPHVADYDPGLIDPCRMNYITKGLPFLDELVSATTYKERSRLIKSEQGREPHFLESAVWGLAGSTEEPLSTYTEEEKKLYIHPPSIIDPESGPKDVWTITHDDMPCQWFVFSYIHIQLRQYGYVMWERERLEKWNLMTLDWHYEYYKCPSSEAYCDMIHSQELRTEVWKKGGRGWWSEDDESQVVYLKRKKKGRKAKK